MLTELRILECMLTELRILNVWWQNLEYWMYVDRTWNIECMLTELGILNVYW